MSGIRERLQRKCEHKKDQKVNYLIRNKKIEDNFYIHYNPHTEEYIVGKSTLGAAVFHYDSGIDFLNVAKLNNEWELEKVNVTKTTSADREAEKKLFDATH